MKKYVKAYTSIEDIEKYLDNYLHQAVRNSANYLYSSASLPDDSPAGDYFVENICEDSRVVEAKDELLDALVTAYRRQKSYSY